MSGSIGPTGPTAPTGPTSTISPIMTHIASLDELLSSHTALAAKETEDTALLQQLISVNRDSLRTNLFSWASNGFPNIYVVLSISLTLSSICSDGVNRNCYDYIEWLTSMTIPDMMANFQSRLTDIEASYSIVGSTIRLHVSRAK